MNTFSLIEQLGTLRDPRQEGKVIHKLSDILLLVICAIIAGCNRIGTLKISCTGNWISLRRKMTAVSDEEMVLKFRLDLDILQ